MSEIVVKFSPKKQLLEMKEAAFKAVFNPKTAQTDRAVLMALINHAITLNAYNIYPGVRLIAQKAGCTVTTVIKSLKRLEAAGWIKKIHENKAFSGGATIWHLNIESFQAKNQETMQNSHPLLNYPAVWRKDALGSNTYCVFRFLSGTRTPLTIIEIMNATGLGRKPVNKSLKLLSGWGLAIKDGRKYYAEIWDNSEDMKKLLQALNKHFLILEREKWKKKKANQARFLRKTLVDSYWKNKRLLQKGEKVYT